MLDCLSVIEGGIPYSCASLAARRLSSSLYFVAVLDVYFTFGSLLARAAVPPFDWKNLVADSLPPTFIIRNCSHCHSRDTSASQRAVRASPLPYRQELWIGRKRCEHPNFDDLKNSPNRGKYQKESRTSLDSFGRNRNISISSAQPVQTRNDMTAYPVCRLSLELFEKLL